MCNCSCAVNIIGIRIWVQGQKEDRREATPGGKPEEVDDCGGCKFVLAETVARRSLRRIRTQLDSTGKIALWYNNFENHAL